MTARFYENFEYLVEKVKSDPRFRIVTYRELVQIYDGGERVIDRAQIPVIRRQLADGFFPMTLPQSYCLTDMLYACRDLLLGKERHVCGKVWGFLEEPYAIAEPMTLTAEEITAAADQIGDGFLPTAIRIGDRQIGPADWLRAALAVLCGEAQVTLTPAPWQIDMDQFPTIRDLKLSGGWIHRADFEDRHLSRRARLQSWTYRLPRGSARYLL